VVVWGFFGFIFSLFLESSYILADSFCPFLVLEQNTTKTSMPINQDTSKRTPLSGNNAHKCLSMFIFLQNLRLDGLKSYGQSSRRAAGLEISLFF